MSFDPNEPTLSTDMPLPPTTPAQATPSHIPSGQYQAPLPAYQGYPYPPPAGPFPAPGMPPYPYPVMPPPRKKSSLLWLWITLGVLGGVTLLGCGICGVLGYLGVSLVQSDTVQAPTRVTLYYQSLQTMDYTKAYTYVSPGASFSITHDDGSTTQISDEETFTSAAQSADQQLGSIESSSPRLVSLNNTVAKIAVTVTRTNKVYVVHLTLNKINGSWKIVEADGI
ncbi:hypothetical protein KSD_21130 [Ktedonobacter sp. SOSP1-85]|uniref:nuclear transport factor 2 family protein n=1 Tax=Ktedonobacter sp. SOSP1-85 TaxID=2778367 RepID=UPI0019153FC4|nr:nuclear transport factor 2 family protein [Ktedonobacter sp. SOSP1-85]GHO74342.1 hypothetical protein KSD_21130 [Ktedonobacter sp. SOSP1-85]